MNSKIRMLLNLAILPGALFLTGCTTNSATGRLQFNGMSRNEEIALGTQAMPQMIEEYGGKVNDQALQDYVTEIGTKLSQYTEGNNPSLPWEYTLLDSDQINAFALPGGKIFITRGLMSKMTNEAQLAGVLGHETGHVTAQHTDDRIARAEIVSIGASIAGAVTKDSNSTWAQYAPVIIGAGGQGYLLHFSRGQESEADTLGMRYMTRAGYNPEGQYQVMEILKEAAAESGGGGIEMLSTHPLPETRMHDIRNIIDTDYHYTKNNPEYGFYENEFQTRALSRLATPPHQQQDNRNRGKRRKQSRSLKK